VGLRGKKRKSLKKPVGETKRTETSHLKSSVATSGSTLNEHPIFCLRHIVNGFCINDCSDKSHGHSFAKKLRELAQLDWKTILNAPRDGQGCEKIDTSALKFEVPPALLKGQDFVLSFRINQRSRLIGIKNGATLQIIAVDPHHNAYDG